MSRIGQKAIAPPTQHNPIHPSIPHTVIANHRTNRRERTTKQNKKKWSDPAMTKHPSDTDKAIFDANQNEMDPHLQPAKQLSAKKTNKKHRSQGFFPFSNRFFQYSSCVAHSLGCIFPCLLLVLTSPSQQGNHPSRTNIMRTILLLLFILSISVAQVCRSSLLISSSFFCSLPFLLSSLPLHCSPNVVV